MNNTLTSDPQLFSAIGSLISAFVALCTVTIYIFHTKYLLKQTKYAEEQLKILELRLEDDRLSRQMEFHSSFQKKLREIQDGMNDLVLLDDDGCQKEDILLAKYWSLVFDEWFICTHGGEDLKELWTSHYSEAIIFALQNPIYREKIESEFNNGRSFLGHHRKFLDEINELSWKAISKGLSVNHS